MSGESCACDKHTDPFPIECIDYVELFVGNPKEKACEFCELFGFSVIAYAGPETGRPDRISYVLAQGDIRFVLTGGLHPDTPSARYVKKHGDGVKNIALRVPNAFEAYQSAIFRGARHVMSPQITEDEHGGVIMRAAIGTFGDTVHSLIDRRSFRGYFLPSCAPVPPACDNGVGLIGIDHIVGNVERGQMDRWVRYYEEVMGFTDLVSFTDQDIKTEYTALMSKVKQNHTGKVKFPINEPAGERKSHVDEYLEANNGPGIQHIALATNDIVSTVRALRKRGVQFSPISPRIYDIMRERFVGVDQVNVDVLQELSILGDRDDDGYMLQIFTRPVVDRPTLFLEFIERQGSKSFGRRIFQVLFDAKELEMKEREAAANCAR